MTRPRAPRHEQPLRGASARDQRRREEPHRDAGAEGVLRGGGLEDVRTYIQSGNVVFTSSERALALVARIEAGLSKAFGYPTSVVVRSRSQLRRVVEGAPAGFGSSPSEYRYDVMFLKEPLTAAEALERVPANPEVDRVSAGGGVLYYSRLVRLASRSRTSRVTALPVYQQMTIRNWNTTTKLLEVMERGSG